MPNLIRDSSGTVAESYRLHVCVCTCVGYILCVGVCICACVCVLEYLCECLHIAEMHVHIQSRYAIEYPSESKDLLACENEPMKTVDECVCILDDPMCLYLN